MRREHRAAQGSWDFVELAAQRELLETMAQRAYAEPAELMAALELRGPMAVLESTEVRELPANRVPLELLVAAGQSAIPEVQV